MRKNKFIALSLALSAFLGTAVPGSAVSTKKQESISTVGPQKQKNVPQNENSTSVNGNSDAKRHESKPLNKKPVANSKKLSLLKWLSGAIVGGLGVNWIANKYGYGLNLFGKKNADQTPSGASPGNSNAPGSKTVSHKKNSYNNQSNISAQTPPQNQHPSANPSQTPNQQNMQLGELQNYNIMQQLGNGSFGTVFKAWDTRTCQNVCIKKMDFHNDDAELKKMQKESHILCDLCHTNVVRYYRSFVENDYYYIVMECLDGSDLEKFLQSNGPLREDLALSYFVQMLYAVKCCHDSKVLHRDLKPQNIMMTNDNHVKLIDFGISRPIDPKNNLAQTQIGTPFYMAPEIFKHVPYGYPADVWSLGCILYEMVTKIRPFGSDYLAFVQNVITNPPFIIQTNVSDQLKELINLMLEKDPVKRITIEKIFKHPAIKSYLMAQQQS